MDIDSIHNEGVKKLNEPTIRVLQPGDEAALEAFLLPRIDSSMFLVGNLRAAGLDDNGERYCAEPGL